MICIPRSRSWGQYWGELGFFRVELGKNLLMIESNIAWASPGTFSTWRSGGGGGGDGRGVAGGLVHHEYVDPSTFFRKQPDQPS